MIDGIIVLAKRNLDGADPVSLRHLQEQWVFKGDELLPVAPLFFLAAIVATVLIAIWCWRSGVLRDLRPAPMQIFRQVIGDFGLARSEIRLLVRIARQQRLSTPLALVLSITTLDHYAQAYVQSMGARKYRQGRFDNQMGRIKKIIFGVDHPVPTDSRLA